MHAFDRTNLADEMNGDRKEYAMEVTECSFAEFRNRKRMNETASAHLERALAKNLRGAIARADIKGEGLANASAIGVEHFQCHFRDNKFIVKSPPMIHACIEALAPTLSFKTIDLIVYTVRLQTTQAPTLLALAKEAFDNQMLQQAADQADPLGRQLPSVHEHREIEDEAAAEALSEALEKRGEEPPPPRGGAACPRPLKAGANENPVMIKHETSLPGERVTTRWRASRPWLGGVRVRCRVCCVCMRPLGWGCDPGVIPTRRGLSSRNRRT